MKQPILSPADFTSLRRQMTPEQILQLAARIEAAYRKAVKVEERSDDAIVMATLDPENKAAAADLTTRAGLCVIRACIDVREHFATHARHSQAALDQLMLALAGADPFRIAELDAAKVRAKASAASVKSKGLTAQKREAKLLRAARKLREKNPALSGTDIGRLLSGQKKSLGGAESLAKKVRRLLPTRVRKKTGGTRRTPPKA